ncbi:MAG TPA: hypothetical protein VJK90_17660 [Acetobacteraceae bacterium]|nr:hypothetical protein [Acetobacteraceae bacterium]
MAVFVAAASVAPRLGIGTTMMVHAGSNGDRAQQGHSPEDNRPG